MKQLDLKVDGKLSGTGIRDITSGEFVEPKEIGISASVTQRISDWLARYWEAHYHDFENEEENKHLDREGVEIAKLIRLEVPDARVRYFSDASMEWITF